MQEIGPSIHELKHAARQKLIDRSITACVMVLAPFVLLYIIEMIAEGWSNKYLIQVTLPGIFLVLLLLKKYLPFHVKAISMILSLFAISFAGLLIYKLPGNAAIVLGCASMLTVLFYGPKAGIVAGFASIAGIFMIFAVTGGSSEPVNNIIVKWVSPVMHFIISMAILAAVYGVYEKEMKFIAAENMRRDKVYGMIAESASDMISYHDMEGRYLFTSPAFEKILGYTPAEMAGKSAYFFICEDDREKAAEHHAVSVKSGDYRVPVTLRMRCKNGDYRWVEAVSRPIEIYGEKGIAVVTRDVTERVKTDLELKESEARFRELYENMAEGVALHEVIFGEDNKTPVNYRILDVNPAYTMHTGLPREKAKNITATDLYGTDKPPYMEEFCGVGVTGKSFHFETYFKPMDKHFRISVISPSYGKFATVFEDITERKKKEKELSDRNAEMERFVYAVSHDLKSPLITIKGFLGILERDMKKPDEAAVKDDFQRLNGAADKMKLLLEDLLKLSRSGRVIGDKEAFRAEYAVNDASEILAAELKSSGASLVINSPMGDIRGDRHRIAEVFQNLMLNSIKYRSPERPIAIEIGRRRSGNEDVFYVKDNGIGIDPKYSNNIFGLFTKLNPDSEGTGIGLALVKRIVEAHGGKIWVVSDGSSGSEFCFSLPE